MSGGHVLVIDGDEWLARLLARVLQERGFAAEIREDARSGFARTCETLPDVVVCSVVLPDIDGFWLARRVRTEGGAVARTPIILVGDIADREARIQGLQVGADVMLERPISNEEIAAQVEALVALVRRVRGDAVEAEPSAPSMAAAFRGDLSSFPLASVLMMLEMERRTGTLEVAASEGRKAMLLLSTGLFASTEIAGETRPHLEVLREVLSWRSGRFAFRTHEVTAAPSSRGSVAAVVLEAMRLEDEENAAS